MILNMIEFGKREKGWPHEYKEFKETEGSFCAVHKSILLSFCRSLLIFMCQFVSLYRNGADDIGYGTIRVVGKPSMNWCDTVC